MSLYVSSSEPFTQNVFQRVAQFKKIAVITIPLLGQNIIGNIEVRVRMHIFYFIKHMVLDLSHP